MVLGSDSNCFFKLNFSAQLLQKWCLQSSRNIELHHFSTKKFI